MEIIICDLHSIVSPGIAKPCSKLAAKSPIAVVISRMHTKIDKLLSIAMEFAFAPAIIDLHFIFEHYLECELQVCSWKMS